MPKYTYKQTDSLSCGAASLMVAARELGATTLPEDLSYGWTGQDFSAAFSQGVEMAIWQVTSEHKNGYSMPANVGKAAQKMGLTPTVHLNGCIVPPLLQYLYPQAMQECRDLGIDVEMSGPGALANNQRQLCVVAIGGLLGLHYIMHRPDGTYMDTADAEDYNWFIAMGQGPGQIIKYLDTGISVVVEKP